MNRRVDSELLLVGNLPAASSEQALRAGGDLFADLTFALPDGETGPREMWTGYEGMNLFAVNPGIEVLRNVEGLPRDIYDIRFYGVRDGVSELHFDSWPRIDDAIESYGVFSKLRDQGVIPPHLRFQVCLPFPTSSLCSLVDFNKDFPIIAPAFEDLMARETERLLDVIPAE